MVEIGYPSLFVREYHCKNTPFSKIKEEKHLVLLKGDFKRLGGVGSSLAKSLSAIKGIETTISKDWLKVRILHGHKWKKIEPLIIEALSQAL